MQGKISQNSEISKDHSSFKSGDRLFEVLNLIVMEIKSKYNMDAAQILSRIELKNDSEPNIPITIFSKELSSLESICKYMKENLGLKNNKIAKMLHRDNRTTWTTYSNAFKKKSEKFEVGDCNIYLPLSIFKERKLSVLESIVSFLKEKHNLNFKEISIYLHRDQRNIWTLYHRSKKKRGIKTT